MLRILLLGPPAVFEDEQPVRIQRRQVRSLLFYLASQNQPIGRAELADIYWPDEIDPRRLLRESLSKLRADLPDGDVLRTEREQVYLDSKAIYVDMLDFEDLLQQSQRAIQQTPRSQPLPEVTCRQMIRALKLWRTARFMDGASLPEGEKIDRWLLEKGTQLENARFFLLERLADHYASVGDFASAIREVRHALAVDDLNPDLNVRHLTWLIRLERRTEALNYCSLIQHRHTQEGLGLDPALKRLIEQITARPELGPAVPATRQWPASLAMQIPFIGRTDLLKNLQRSYYRGGVAVVMGEGGAGKTRLVYELYHSFEPAPRLLLATCRSVGVNSPFQSLLELLRYSIHVEELKALERTWAIQLQRIMPDLTQLRIDLPPLAGSAGEEARSLIFEALLHLLLQVADHRRVLLFVDDAQWCDEASLAALSYLLEHGFFERSGFLVVTARVEEPNPYLSEFLDRPHFSSKFASYHLELLSGEEIAEISRFILGETPAPHVVERLKRDTGGNPLFLLETLRVVLQYLPQANLLDNLDALPLAGSVHALLRERLRQLSAQTRAIISIAAIVGSQFTPQILQNASQYNPDQVTLAFEELEQASLIQPVVESADAAYTFVHERIREVLLLELSQARRQLLHLRVARALEALPNGLSDESAAVLAQHYESAGEALLAYRCWVRAGKHARWLFSKEEAYHIFQRAERLIPLVGAALLPADLYGLFCTRGELALDLNDLETAQRDYQDLHRWGEELCSPLLVGSALSGLGYLFYLHQNYERAFPTLQEARQALADTNDLYEQVEVVNRLGMLLTALNQQEQAVQLFEKFIHRLPVVHDLRLLRTHLNTQYQLGQAYIFSGWPAKALALSERAVEDSQRLGYLPGITRAFMVLGMARFYLGHYAESRQALDDGLEIAELAQQKLMVANLLAQRARTWLAMGFIDHAWQDVAESMQIGQAGNYPEAVSEAYSILGDTYRLLGMLAQAEDSYQQGMLIGRGYQFISNQAHWGQTRALAGDFESGQLAMQAAISQARAANLAILFIPSEYALMVSQVQVGALLLANERVEVLEKEVQGCNLPAMLLLSRWVKAHLMLAQGDSSAAQESARLICAYAIDHQNPWQELLGHQLQQAAHRKSDLLVHVDGQRVLAIAKLLEDNANLPELRPHVLAYCQQLRKMLN